MSQTYDLEYIAKQCNVKSGAIRAYIKYCVEYGIEIPSPIPYSKTIYTYTKENADKIAQMFKNKKRGEMAQYNYDHNWGAGYRNRHKK